MFSADREVVLETLYRMGATCCAYSMNSSWANRCDCKYGLHEKWPVVGERGNGCPELRSLYDLVGAMTDEEWARLVDRAGGVLMVAILDGEGIGARLHRAKRAARDAEASIAHVREALDG